MQKFYFCQAEVELPNSSKYLRKRSNDTIYAETEVLEMRASKSRPNAGIVKFKHWDRKSDGTIVVEFERTAMFLKKIQMLDFPPQISQ